MKIINDFNLNELKKYGSYYIKNENMYVSVYRNQLQFIDLTNALKTGKECKGTVMTTTGNNTYHDAMHAFINFVDDYPLSEVIENLRSGFYNGKQFGDIDFFPNNKPSNKTFSPFVTYKPQNLAKIKRVSQIVKAILAGQAKEIICKGYYTDDYAYDASVNFEIGKTQEPLDFAEKLTSSRGWTVFDYNEQTKSINMAHYQFEYQQIVFQ